MSDENDLHYDQPDIAALVVHRVAHTDLANRIGQTSCTRSALTLSMLIDWNDRRRLQRYS